MGDKVEIKEVGGEEVEDKVGSRLGKEWVKWEMEDREGYDEKMEEIKKNKKKYFGDLY